MPFPRSSRAGASLNAAFGVPRPIIYVLDKSGTIRLRYMEPTYRTGPDLELVLRDAAALNL